MIKEVSQLKAAKREQKKKPKMAVHSRGWIALHLTGVIKKKRKIH